MYKRKNKRVAGRKRKSLNKEGIKRTGFNKLVRETRERIAVCVGPCFCIYFPLIRFMNIVSEATQQYDSTEGEVGDSDEEYGGPA